MRVRADLRKAGLCRDVDVLRFDVHKDKLIKVHGLSMQTEVGPIK